MLLGLQSVCFTPGAFYKRTFTDFPTGDDEGYGDGARIVERALYPKVSTTKSLESIILTFQQALSDSGKKQDRVWGLTC